MRTRTVRQDVVFITGTSWSGSTLLEQGLAQLDGWASVGELSWIWHPRWSAMRCECGTPLARCEFWRSALDDAYGASSSSVQAELRRLARGLWRHSIFPTMVRARHWSPNTALQEVGDLAAPLYRAVAQEARASTVVDASKAPLWGSALARTDALDLAVVHLVRDPAGYAASDGRQRKMPFPTGPAPAPRRPSRSLVTWLLLNLEAEALTRRNARSVRLLFDDLVRTPRQATERAARVVGRPVDVRAHFAGNQLVVRRAGHAIGGNPRRPRVGRTEISREPSPPARLPAWLRGSLLPIANIEYGHIEREAAMS